MRSRQSTIAWVSRYRAAGLPAAHIVALTGLELLELESLPSTRSLPPALRQGARMRRPILAQTANKVKTLIDLGYSRGRIASILVLDPRRVADFVRRSTPDRREVLSRPRTRREQRALELHQAVRQATCQARAQEIAKRWKNARNGRPPAAGLDDAGAPELVDQADGAGATQSPELTAIAAAPPLEGARWSGDFHPRFRGSLKLKSEHIAQARQLLAGGESYRSVAKRFGVATNTLRTHVGSKPENPSPALPPPEWDDNPETAGIP